MRKPLQLKVHADASSFLGAAGALLNAAEAEYSIISLPAARMIEAPRAEDAQAYMASVAGAGGVVAAALQIPPGGVLLTRGPPEALAAIARDMARREPRPDSIVGPRVACAAFGEEWQRQTGDAFQPRFELRHFELTAEPQMSGASGAMRAATAKDHDRIVEWSLAFINEVGLPDEAERVLLMVARRIEREEFYLWEDGDVVAMAGFRDAGSASATARIAPVFTPPSLRGRGYATAVVSALSRELFARGKRAVYLTADLANPVSNAIYEKIGYRAVADHVHFDVVPAST